MKDLADLAGLQFKAKSGNSGIVQILADDALRITYTRKPSREDIGEAEAWVHRLLGGGSRLTRFTGGTSQRAEERAALDEFHRRKRAAKKAEKENG